MRRVDQTKAFKRDLKREARGRYAASLEDELLATIESLANDQPLETRYRDDLLTGNWKDHRDCHIRPDLVLIDRKPDAETLQLVRLGSHPELAL